MGSDNGSGNRDIGVSEDTPNERPQATLAAHRPYVFALTNVCSELSRTNHILAALLHDIRVATEEIGDDARHGIGKALVDLGETFGMHGAQFLKQEPR